MIVDAHCHVWPDAVAERALAWSKPEDRFGDGTVASLDAVMTAAGVDRAVCLGIGNTPDRVAAANRFVGSLDPNRFIGFGSVHPELSVEENLDGLRQNGLRGAKVHPYFQNYALDDPRLWEVFDAMQEEFCVIAHVGAASDHDGSRCTPQMVRDIVENFPRLAFVACHFGGYHVLEAAEASVLGEVPVFVDTSWPPSLSTLESSYVHKLIERHGPDRVIFASDWPMADPATERAFIEGLGFADDDLAGMLGGNLCRLIGLD